jgi:hypothetical protein
LAQFFLRVWFTSFSEPKRSPSGDLRYSADYAELEVEEHRAGHVLAAQGLVVKHVDAAEVRTVVAAVLAAAAYALLVAHHLQNLVPIWLPHGLLKK